MVYNNFRLKHWGTVAREKYPSNAIGSGIAEATCPYPGMGVFKGTADNQLKVATEEAVNVLGIALEDDRGIRDIDSIYVAGDPLRYMRLGACVECAVIILANIADIAKGDPLVISSTAGKWKVHPDDLSAITKTGDQTVTSDKTDEATVVISGFAKQPSQIQANESLTKDASYDQLLKAVV